jgi:hypothetical protein
VHGNWSKYAINWVAGPTHEVWVQRVPNYTGHVKGLESENLFGMSYAKKTAKAISRRHPIGADLCPRNRFRSSQREDFKPSNFRRFVENKDMIPQRDYKDFTKYVNENNTVTKESLLSRTMRRPAFATSYDIKRSGLSTAKAGGPMSSMTSEQLDTVMNKSEQGIFKKQQGGAKRRTFSIDTRNMSMTQVKPKMLETNVVNQPDFYNLSEGFKKVFACDKEDQKMVIPVVGYGGHRRGDRC